MTRSSTFLRITFPFALFLACLGCPGKIVDTLGNHIGRVEPISLTLKPGASADFQFSADNNGYADVTFNTADVKWTIEGGPTFPVGTVANAPGQNPQAKTVVGRFQSVASLPAGTNQVTFRILAYYGPFSTDHVQAFTTVTLDVNAPPSASEEKTP